MSSCPLFAAVLHDARCSLLMSSAGETLCVLLVGIALSSSFHARRSPQHSLQLNHLVSLLHILECIHQPVGLGMVPCKAFRRLSHGMWCYGSPLLYLALVVRNWRCRDYSTLHHSADAHQLLFNIPMQFRGLLLFV